MDEHSPANIGEPLGAAENADRFGRSDLRSVPFDGHQLTERPGEKADDLGIESGVVLGAGRAGLRHWGWVWNADFSRAATSIGGRTT